jgi:nucleoside-diphosphate-sugar epimerase
MRVLLAGATGAIGRPLIRGLKQHGHSVFGLVRSAESTRMLTEMGAEAVIGDALDAASVRAAIARVRPDGVINELTSLPRHYTPAEMKAAAERDSRVRREGSVKPSCRHARERCATLRHAVFGILVCARSRVG